MKQNKLQKTKKLKKKSTKKIQITIDISLLAWIDSVVKKGYFAPDHMV